MAADSILSKLNLSDIERELAQRRREVAVLAGIRSALRRKATLDDVDRRIREQRDRAEPSR